MSLSEISLARADPSRLWNWVLARQGIYDGNGLPALDDVVERTLGLHAARIQSPFLAAAARLAEPARAVGLLGTVPTPELMTIRSVRRTLHVMTARHASVAHGATVRYRLQNVHSMGRRSSLSQARIGAVSDAVVAHIGKSGPCGERMIEAAMRHAHSIVEVRLALKLAWESGYIAFHNASGSWDALRRHFELAATWHPTFDRDRPGPDSARELLNAYLDRYGPVTVADAAWWSGLGQATVREAFSRQAVVRLRLPWAKSDFFMTEGALADFEADMMHGAVVTSGVALLGGEDCALKAYNESRNRYLFGRPQQICFNAIGEVQPTILRDGKVVGRWHWDRAALDIRLSHFDEYKATRSEREQSERGAQNLSDVLRRHLRTTVRSEH